MSVTALAFAVTSWMYVGFQWTIRVVVYPQFDQVASSGFVDYERMHQRRVSRAVGPLFAALVITAAAVVVHPPAAAPRWAPFGAAALVGLVLGETALLAVPLHRRLSDGFDPATFRRLLNLDSLRLATAIGSAVLGVVILSA